MSENFSVHSIYLLPSNKVYFTYQELSWRTYASAIFETQYVERIFNEIDCPFNGTSQVEKYVSEIQNIFHLKS